jgi:Family of unknown function (DUF6166)
MELQHKQQPKTTLDNELPNAALPSLNLPHLADAIYRGIRHPDGRCEVCVDEPSTATPFRQAAKTSRPLPLHLELRNHSPTGFAWGYCGSGPAQLALAVLTDATGEQALALRHYQEFKFRFVSGWSDSWTISRDEINSFIAAQENPAACRPA